ncbi:Protein phosphatase 2C [Spironucleus salmonicida]|nr:Protein phosphatase 2C [Spironucleus salmonicida]KAH0574019.1 Protein phosphatase 2C [Spironucleus salmonicida]|eukprot:EST48344.1 Protein phosphatase 2C [Spironucleus salmonicida]
MQHIIAGAPKMYYTGAFSQQFGKGQDRFLVHTSPYRGYQLLAIFDGHGETADAANFLQRNFAAFAEASDFTDPAALQQFHLRVLELDAQFNRQFKTRSGATLCAVFLSEHATLAFNLGDSAAICASRTSRQPAPLSTPHSIEQPQELARIRLNGGTVENGRFFPETTQDSWSFMVTRSFGNGFAKGRSLTASGDFFTSRPDYVPCKRGGKIQQFTGDFEWVLCFSDGLEVLKNSDICHFVNEQLGKYALTRNNEFANPNIICQKLVHKCYDRCRHLSYIDDISCCLAIKRSVLDIQKPVQVQHIRAPQTRQSFQRKLQPLDFCVYFDSFQLNLRQNYNKYLKMNKTIDLMYGRGQGDFKDFYCCLNDHQKVDISADFIKKEDLVLTALKMK